MLSFYNIIILDFFITISLLIELSFNNTFYFLYLNLSKITLKIKGRGRKDIFCSGGSFNRSNHPDIIHINGEVKTTVNSNYYLDNEINIIILEWIIDRENYSHIFHGCSYINEIDLSFFNTSQVKWMGSMFRGCSLLTSINFTNFNTTMAKDMGFMFQGCKSLTSIDLSCFNTSNVILMWLMFADCISLTTLNLHNFDITCVTNMEGFLKGCSNLEYIDLFNFKENNNLFVGDMFDTIPNNVVVCINEDNINNNILTELDKKRCYTIIEECNANWKSKQRKIVEPTGQCFEDYSYHYQYNIIDILTEINETIINKELNDYDKILEIIEKYFSLRVYNTSNIDKGKEEQISVGKMNVTLTTSGIQKTNIYNEAYITNTTLIDLGQCEISLRSFYNISNDTSLYILKIDVIQDGMQIPKVEYDVYSRLGGKKLQKLNLSICENDKINIYTYIDSIPNIDIINPKSRYYTDICYPTTSDFGTDITLNDRKEEFVEKNKTVCQEDCVFVGYNYKTKKANCSCDVKESSGFFENIVINRKKLYQNFLDINTIANVDFLLCYKMLFCKKGLLKNIGSYILLFFILLHIVCIIIFYIKSFPKLKKKINHIFNSKINLITTKFNKENKNKKLKYKNIFIQNKNKNINFNKRLLFEFKTHKRRRKNSKNQSKKNKIKKIKIKKPYSNILKYTDDEINDLSYELAIKNDKRTYFQYYISLIKTKHDIYFSFFYNKDYNAKIIKIDLFFLGFIFSYVINGLFFDDETMHKIYKDKGSFDFLYQLPKTIYSSIISLFFDYIFKLLPLSNDIILDFKNSKLAHKKVKKNLNIKLKIKFLLYFIISSIFLILFWYYIGMFGVIYKNTQIHLIQDTLFSFIESSIYPFWINLLPGIFRIIALSNQKNKRRYLYRFSQILQIL